MWHLGCGGIDCGSQLLSLYSELGPKSWPDSTSALAAIADAEAQRFLGQACYVPETSTFGRYKGTIAQFIAETPLYVDSQSSAGVPVKVYRQLSAFNTAGERCSVFIYQHVMDGAYYNTSQCRQRYSIRIENPGTPSSTASLADVEPGKSVALVARVYDQNNQVVPSVSIRLEATVDAFSGGHQHDTGRHSNTATDNRLGRLDPLPPSQGTVTASGAVLTGNSGTDGLVFNFVAPPVAGDHPILASCTDGKTCAQEGPKQVWVGVKNLRQIPGSSVYQLITPNADTYHPDNHFLTDAAINRLTVLAALYRGDLKRLFPEPQFDFKLHLNDASLVRGGIFDIWRTWKRPHAEHCMGAAIDIRANDAPGAIPGWYYAAFQKLVGKVGATLASDENSGVEIPFDENGVPQGHLRHYHVRLMGNQEGLECPR
jgi:hypothetical protein